MFKLFASKKNPQGPDWAKAQSHCLVFSGTKIAFSTPPHTDPIRPFKPEPEKYNIYDETRFWQSPKGNNPARFLEGGYSAAWQFKGNPLFSAIGSLNFSIGIIRNSEFGSLNRPKNFISAINQFLNCIAGPLSGQIKNQYRIRTNWVIHTIDNTPFVSYEKSEPIHTACYRDTPISDEHYVSMVFQKHIFKPADIQNNTYLNTAYDELIEHIINSVRIEWSTDALKQQADAKTKWPDETLPETLAELIWPDEEWLANESEHDRYYLDTHRNKSLNII